MGEKKIHKCYKTLWELGMNKGRGRISEEGVKKGIGFQNLTWKERQRKWHKQRNRK